MTEKREKPALDGWRWPTDWRLVRLPEDTAADFRLEMEIAEMMSSFEEREPEAYAKLMQQQPNPLAKE